MKKNKLSKKELEAGLASGQITYKDPKAKHRKGYEVRIASDSEASDFYPTFRDHPFSEGTIEYKKHVDTSPLATVWEAVANEHYANQGIPSWVRKSLTPLHVSVYWQMVHYQMVWGGTARMSLHTLEANLGVHYRSVQRSVHRLLDIGAIELIRKHSGRRPAAYRVVLLSSIENKKVVETTHQNVETTSENRIDDQSVVQKTKPLKGRVARSPADAVRATPREKKSQTLRTIDEDRTFRAKQRVKEERASRPQLIRFFFPVEVRKEKLEELLEIELLKAKWKSVLELAKVSGGVDLEKEIFIPAPEASEEKLFEYVQNFLTSNKFDVRNLSKAFDLALDSYLKLKTPHKQKLELELKNFLDQKERESRIQKERAREEAERLLQRQKKHEETFEYLERARELFLAVFPNLQEKIDSWGSVSNFLYELQGKESNRIENLEIRSKLYELSKAIPKKLLELNYEEESALASSSLEKKLECWIEGGEEWGKLRFF
jgi:hypothetical protein